MNVPNTVHGPSEDTVLMLFAARHRQCSLDAVRASHVVQVAYLASTLFLDSNSDLIVLIVNTITRDLADDNMLIGERVTSDTISAL